MNQVYYVALGNRTTVNELFDQITTILQTYFDTAYIGRQYREFHVGDERHSLADISKAQRLLGFARTHLVRDGLAEAMAWYIRSY